MISTAITDREIAILCDVAERHAGFFNAEKREILDQLVGRGFVERSDRDSEFVLSGMAGQLLAERGVGLCEA
jgi:hypothetical protein